ncbi:hypothetical protein LUZ60_016470 [Juncus effusus]|nr:hypothetical protein LUZ60_016470 [Juncus effusus]
MRGSVLCLLCICLCMAMLIGATNGGEEREKISGEIHSRSTEKGWPGYLYIRTIGKCTPQYWSSGREAWPNIAPKHAAVFGSRVLERYEPSLTLLDATQRNDDIGGTVFAKLVKHATAALLNSYTRDNFPLDSWEVKSLMLEALVSEESAEAQAEHFEQANESCTSN